MISYNISIFVNVMEVITCSEIGIISCNGFGNILIHMICSIYNHTAHFLPIEVMTIDKTRYPLFSWTITSCEFCKTSNLVIF